MALPHFLLLILILLTICTESKYIPYNTTAGIVADKLNVHIVPHSHDDVGWLKTVDQYYLGSNNSIQGACVQDILDSLVPALLADKNRKFIYVEQAFFQRWWRQQSDGIQKIVKKLVSSGQLEFINGGMCMHDEAAVHYIDMIDQTTLGHRYIKDQFGQIPRIGWQIDPFGHSAVQAYLLSAEVGFDALYFSRIDYQDREKRKDLKNLEVIWRASKTLGSSADVFTGIFPQNYEPPPGHFYYEVNADNDDSPVVQDDPLLFDYNVEERVNDFVAAAVSQANITRTNHIMFTMGTDFRYQYATSWFRQLDKFVHYVNKDGRVNAFYSTPSIYTDAKYAANETWPLKIDDFFPYADNANAYWTGYFTSRPALKGYVRMMSGYYLAVRQLEFLKGRNSSGPSSESLADALAIAQHHDAVSGTEKQHVANDYAKRLSIGYAEAEKVVGSALACLTESVSNSGCHSPTTKFEQCPLINVSYCPPSEVDLSQGKTLVVLVYNPLGWNRDDIVRIPVLGESVVFDSEGNGIESQLIPLVKFSVDMRTKHTKAYLGVSPGVAPKYWLVFQVSVPPLGFNTYYISSSKGKGSIIPASSVYSSGGSEQGNIEVGQGDLKLLYNVEKGALTHYLNGKNSIRDYRSDWDLQVHQPVAGNYYPINLGMYIEDTSTEFSVLVDRSLGGASISDGQMELMLHRRLLHDDGRGVAEALNETVCVADKCFGLIVQGKLYLKFDPLGKGAKWRRTFGQKLYSPLLLAFSEQDSGAWIKNHITKFSAMDSSYSLPDNVAVITLEALDNGSVLLRLAHLYEAGEDTDLSVQAFVELKKVFPGKKISKVIEMNLSANQERTAMEKKRLKWRSEGYKGAEAARRGGQVDSSELVVELGPMEIRTFTVKFDFIFYKL